MNKGLIGALVVVIMAVCHLALNCKIAVVFDGLGTLFEILNVFSLKLTASGEDLVARTPG